MKRIFTIIAIALGLVLPMQAQRAHISKEIKAENGIARKMIRKAPAAQITVDDIVGTYDAVAQSAFQGYPAQKWTVTITADENDANKLWIQPVCTVVEDIIPAEYLAPVYATFNAEKGTLSMPLGQVVYDADATVATAASSDGANIDIKSQIDLAISNTSKGITITFADQFYFGYVDPNDVKGGWYQAIYEISYTKAVAVPNVYIYNKGSEAPVRVKASQLYFNEVDGEMCVTTTPEVNVGFDGVYQAYAESAFQGYPAEEWTITVTRDNDDTNKYWLHPICSISGLEPDYISPVYVIYNEADGSVVMPLGQAIFAQSGYNIVLCASNGETMDLTGNYMLAYSNNAIISDDNRVIGAVDQNDPEGGWYNAYMGYIFSKDAGKAFPVADIDRITREKPEVSGDFTYIKPGQYTWTYGLPVSETDLEYYTSTTTFAAGEQFDLGEWFKGGEGIIGTNWAISGLFKELGIYEDGNTPEIPAITYTIEDEEGTYEIFVLFDTNNEEFYCYSSIGNLPVEEEDGTIVNRDIFIADYDGQALYQPSFVAMSEDEIIFDGSVLMFFYVGDDGYAYPMFTIYDPTIEPSTGAAAPMRGKVVIDTNVERKPIAINKATIRK